VLAVVTCTTHWCTFQSPFQIKSVMGALHPVCADAQVRAAAIQGLIDGRTGVHLRVRPRARRALRRRLRVAAGYRRGSGCRLGARDPVAAGSEQPQQRGVCAAEVVAGDTSRCDAGPQPWPRTFADPPHILQPGGRMLRRQRRAQGLRTGERDPSPAWVLVMGFVTGLHEL